MRLKKRLYGEVQGVIWRGEMRKEGGGVMPKKERTAVIRKRNRAKNAVFSAKSTSNRQVK